MTDNLMHILIFKTNINTLSDKHRIEELFSKHTGIDEWHVDSEDIDCVLRVISYVLQADEIIKLITNAGFECQEL